FLIIFIIPGLFNAGLFFESKALMAASTRRPNVIFILTDDQGWTDLNCHGDDCKARAGGECTCHDRDCPALTGGECRCGQPNRYDKPDIKTPHLRSLKEAGIRFTNAYMACPYCAPSRASLLTGKYPARNDMTGFWFFDVGNSTGLNPIMTGAYHHKELPYKEKTIAEALHGDYVSFSVGKYQLTDPHSYPSHNAYGAGMRGFEFSMNFRLDFQPENDYLEGNGPGYFDRYYLPGLAGALDSSGNYPFDSQTLWGDADLSPNFKFLDQITRENNDPDNEYLTDATTIKTLDFIDKWSSAQGEPDNKMNGIPFFLFVTYNSPHAPIQIRNDSRVFNDDKAKYYKTMIRMLDECIGAISAKIKAGPPELRDNTYVIYTSDNGGDSDLGSTTNAPLKWGKRSMHEGGIRVPLIITGPGIPANRSCSIPVISVDFFPTLLEWAGKDASDFSDIDGRSLVPLLTNPDPEEDGFSFDRNGDDNRENDAIFFHKPHRVAPESIGSAVTIDNFPSCAVRRGNYKLIVFYDYYKSLYTWPDHFISNPNHPKYLDLRYHTPQKLYRLYDLSKDIGEQHDLSLSADPAIQAVKKQLIVLLEGESEKDPNGWLQKVNARMPRIKVVKYSVSKPGGVPYPSVQAAVRAAGHGDTIVICRGTHQETIDFSVLDNLTDLTLKSTLPDNFECVEDTKIVWPGKTGSVISLKSTGKIHIEGITITGPLAGVNGNGNSDGSLKNCIIQACGGGGIVDFDGRLTNCIIRDNDGVNGAGLRDCDGLIDNCILFSNRATGKGGGLYNCDGVIINSIIAGNIATEGGGLYGCEGGKISNCIIWGNLAGTAPQLPDDAAPDHSCIQDWTSGGKENGSHNPGFINFYKFIDLTSSDVNTGPPDKREFLFNRLYVKQSKSWNGGMTGGIIEYDNDGVPRTIKEIEEVVRNGENHYKITFHPPISPETRADKPVFYWGPNVTSVFEDFHRKKPTPVINAEVSGSVNETGESEMAGQE
ncbi:MAG: sulfatase-like hydrolase/transferase, partial [Sedimentisphaerales bacterium]|nr:sulfatase-like hydrolase/transferase [Sedimentisphaerales bacterium]